MKKIKHQKPVKPEFIERRMAFLERTKATHSEIYLLDKGFAILKVILQPVDGSSKYDTMTLSIESTKATKTFGFNSNEQGE